MKVEIKSWRWLLLFAGIVAGIGITAMNVYSLYTLRDSSRETARQSQKIQVAEFSDRIRHRFFDPFFGLSSVEMQKLEQTFAQKRQFEGKALHVIAKASQDSIFDNIYYIPARSNACKKDDPLLRFDFHQKAFKPTRRYSTVVCDGMGIARTRMRALISDYRYNNKVLFDTHRSMVIALVNQDNRSVIGYLAMPINRSYMTTHYLQPKLEKKFGPRTHSNLDVWLRDWTNGDIIASSNPQKKFDHNNIEFAQQFPDFFDDWRLYASVDHGAVDAAFGPSLWKNLALLGAAFIFLIGAMLFMFFTARRERALAERQSDFLANVTHELKTPISVMQAAGENLADGRVDNQQRLQSYGEHIHSEALRLQHMIDRLLDVAKADAGQSFVHRKSVQINKVIQDFIAEHRPYLADRGFTLEVRIADSVSPVRIDPQSMHTILNNLMNNAIKYSNGNRFLGIYLDQPADKVRLRVEDHGVGMSKKSIRHIFEKFYRAEDALTAKTKGYGLGLSIVKNLVSLNGGTIHVESKEGEGSTFTLTFPALRETAPKPSSNDQTSSTPAATTSPN